MATTLAIAHHVFLTKEQRYNLHAGQDIEVVGVNTPVWYHKGITSEPATEVFCKYILHNKQDEIFISNNANGYDISLPHCQKKLIEDLPKNVWIPLSQKQQAILLMEDTPCLDELLDFQDGGSEWLAFRQFSKVTKNNKTLNVVHFVEIKTIEELERTISN